MNASVVVNMMDAVKEIGALTQHEYQEKIMRKLAHEIATDILPLKTILKTYGISEKQFTELSNHSGFQRYLREAVESWNSADNTAGRTKLKISSGIEDSLPMMFMKLHDENWPASARVELLKTLLRAAGMAQPEGESTGGGDKVQININLSRAQEPVVIEHEMPTKYVGAEDA